MDVSKMVAYALLGGDDTKVSMTKGNTYALLGGDDTKVSMTKGNAYALLGGNDTKATLTKAVAYVLEYNADSIVVLSPQWGSMGFSDGYVGILYSETWTMPVGVNSPTTYVVVAGSIPSGLSLSNISGTTGRISGTPTTAGTFNFVLRATNAYGISDQLFTIVIGSTSSSGVSTESSYAFVS